MPRVPKGQRHPFPDYEIKIDFSEWWIEDTEGNMVETSESSREDAEEAAQLLVGDRVTSCDMVDPIPALEIRFAGGHRIRMRPYNHPKAPRREAWVLTIRPFYGFARWDGTLGNGRTDKPILDDVD